MPAGYDMMHWQTLFVNNGAKQEAPAAYTIYGRTAGIAHASNFANQ